jgi:diguanylate cyclase (GGDEF)-like protein
MRFTDQLEAKLATTEARLEALTEQVRQNDEKLRCSQRRELQLLQARDLDELLHEMTSGLRDSFDLRHVSVVLRDPGHDIRHLLLATDVGEIPGLILVDTLAGLAPQYSALQRPWLGRFAASDHGMIVASPIGLASIAMIPLRCRDELIGSINLCSADPHRFTVHHASDFLAHLGAIASFSVENAVNRARLRRSGFTDVLTGWHNRRYLQARMKEELARACRDGRNLVCLILDIDHFKRVNDTWGHAAGDIVLRELAQRIDAQVRASDVAARFGGEEFVILLPNTKGADGQRLAERIRNAVAAAPFELPEGEQISVTVSIGIAEFAPGAGGSDLKSLGEALIARADAALYAASSEPGTAVRRSPRSAPRRAAAGERAGFARAYPRRRAMHRRQAPRPARRHGDRCRRTCGSGGARRGR